MAGKTAEAPAPWINVATRKIAGSPTAGIPMQTEVMAELSVTYPQNEWDLVDTHYIGTEPNILVVMFVFTRKAAVTI